ncbi:AraC family transcriptional regulator [Bordetella phage vB_BbrM_PHB04]|uniref:AraC family transcriptional regulator n=1 Tax=Bordetella phage vB_BbrM_PHB04 TaxID=2029657 RepID=A0A291LAM3_9CAUD|nr:transcriptional regulator [Bordetella phage vB_BbrM_PHB04]ATI15666.1 AraC family transcriptional regulator [Bordetella phage vB_BbrM_PHB04]
MIRVNDEAFKRATSCDLQYDSAELRYVGMSNPIVSRIATTVAISLVQHPPCALLVDSLATTLSIAVLNEITGRPRKEMSGALCPKRKQRVIEYIEANIGDPITLSELASVAALSPHHFSRSFRRTFGVSPVRYVWTRRIDMAKRLMRYSALPLAAVALTCGFSSQSHFSTAFRVATGVTPAAYMRTITDIARPRDSRAT